MMNISVITFPQPLWQSVVLRDFFWCEDIVLDADNHKYGSNGFFQTDFNTDLLFLLSNRKVFAVTMGLIIFIKIV